MNLPAKLACPKCENENIHSTDLGIWADITGESFDPNLHTCKVCMHRWQDLDYLRAIGMTDEEISAEKQDVTKGTIARLMGQGLTMRQLGEYLANHKALRESAKRKRSKQLKGLLRARRLARANKGSKAQKRR